MSENLKLWDIIDSFVSGDWGNEEESPEAPCCVSCIRGADIVPICNSDFDNIPIRYISNRSFTTHCLQEGDIIVEKSGGSPTQSTGRVVYISKELLAAKHDIVCSNFCVAFRVKPEWNSLYIYYYLRNVYNAGVFFNFEGKTSGIKNLDIETAFRAIPIKAIAMETQLSIATAISCLDKKIALNRAINDNLEAMAKQLYDYWFVQFDFPNEESKPYKSSGGKMVWNDKLKREIPEGWDVDALNTWLEIKSGFPFKSETYQTSGRYKVITIKNVQEGELVTSGCDFVDEIPSRAKEYIALKIGDRLISLTGNCGRLCVVCEENLLLNQRVGLLSCNSLYLEYLYNLLNSQLMRMVVDNLANGAAQANLSPVELCKTICAMPQEDTLLEYNRKANVFRLAMVQNNQEIATLTKQRDELLPLLMNGQVSVNYHLSHD